MVSRDTSNWNHIRQKMTAYFTEGGILLQQNGRRATWCQPALCGGWLAWMCQDQRRSDMSLTREGCATNMDEKDMEAREGGSEEATRL